MIFLSTRNWFAFPHFMAGWIFFKIFYEKMLIRIDSPESLFLFHLQICINLSTSERSDYCLSNFWFLCFLLFSISFIYYYCFLFSFSIILFLSNSYLEASKVFIFIWTSYKFRNKIIDMRNTPTTITK